MSAGKERTAQVGDAVALDPALLAILVCPLTRTPLRQEGTELVSDAAGLAFPIENGSPILIVDLARRLDRA